MVWWTCLNIIFKIYIYKEIYKPSEKKKKKLPAALAWDVLQMQKVVDKSLQEQFFRSEIGSASNILERLIFLDGSDHKSMLIMQVNVNNAWL